VQVRRVATRRPSLEDVFVSLIEPERAGAGTEPGGRDG